MQEKRKIKSKQNPRISPTPQKKKSEKENFPFLWILFLAGIAFICLSPMLKNGFTNWDDEQYVISNLLLRGPDWKGIFSQPVVSNYHPLTILTLAFNWAISKSSPFSYLLLNLVLHVFNTILLFYFIWIITDKKKWVAFFTALLFAIHPMHVESVAWVSERKDVLYTLFFFLALIKYWQYIQTARMVNYGYCLLWFILSLLSKPSAIVLPLVLLLLDYWKGRSFDKKLIYEKIPFLILAVVSGIILLKIQSIKAIAGLDLYPFWSRPLFACYVIMIYAVRFFVPYPLSAFHPYPAPDHLGWMVLVSPLFIVALLIFTWWQRKNRWFVFGILFFILNLLLVLQIVSIGNTIVSERYTYVPYVGLAFIVSMWLYHLEGKPGKQPARAALAVVIVLFCILTFQRTKIWKDSFTLWTDVINHYPNAPIPRTNRSNYLAKLADTPEYASEAQSLFQRALEDCNVALKAKPNHIAGYEDRGLLFLRLNRIEEARADGDSLIKLAPKNKTGYTVRGTAYFRLNEPEKAMADFNSLLVLFPDDDYSLVMRGSLFVNQFKKYPEALNDFSRAIQLNPQASYYLNRSKCYYNMGDVANAKSDAESALQKGMNVDENYKKLLNM